MSCRKLSEKTSAGIAVVPHHGSAFQDSEMQPDHFNAVHFPASLQEVLPELLRLVHQWEAHTPASLRQRCVGLFTPTRIRGLSESVSLTWFFRQSASASLCRPSGQTLITDSRSDALLTEQSGWRVAVPRSELPSTPTVRFGPRGSRSLASMRWRVAPGGPAGRSAVDLSVAWVRLPHPRFAWLKA